MLIFKVGTIASMLGVHRNTVTNWIKKGKLEACSYAGRKYAVSRSKFIAFCKREHIAGPVMDKIIREFDLPEDRDAENLMSPKTMHETDMDSGSDMQIGSVLVVGGGISGIQAALELADAGYYVYIVEKTAGIGGTMAQLDKTFPTNDCASCIILPKLVECGRHLNIELITLAMVEKVRGRAGHFIVNIRKNPSYIDADKCIACGICAQKCPINVQDEFNFGISRRKAVYIRYDQSVPLKYAIDPEACIYLTHGKCGACEKFCSTGAVNFSQAGQLITIHVGAVILAPGFKPFDPSGHDFFGYRVKDVVTSLEYERMLSIGGPGKGTLARPSDNTEPRKIAWIQCVGSRNHNNCGNSYCSNICCMAAVKQSLISPEHVSAGELEQTIFFTDLRSHGKESERYFESAKKAGVRFVRALPHTMEPGHDGTGVRMRYVTEQGEVIRESFDLAVLSIGFEAPSDAPELARLFNIELDSHNFAATSCMEPVNSSRNGIYVIGAFQTPKAISRSVVQASAAAASAARLLGGKRGSAARKKQYPRERDISNETPSVGVFVCSCGVNIAGIVDVDQVVAYAAGLPFVTYVENNLFSCSADAQQVIVERIHEFGLNRIVIAACTPRTHELMFQETLKTARLNGFMVEMANIRNQNSWVHQQDARSATQKAKDQVRMAIAKVVHHYPLKQDSISLIKRALIVGGGLVGLEAALSLARMDIETIVIEKTGTLGGNARRLDTCFKGERLEPLINELIEKTGKSSKIRIYKNAELDSVSGSVGNFRAGVRIDGQIKTIEFGAAIMATGGREASTREYLYGKDPRVMTQMEFDRKILYHSGEPSGIQTVVFIQCVGSRETSRPYCSRVCCIHSVKAAIDLKHKNPDLQVYILYRELRTYGEWESYYKEARDLGVVFIRYERKSKPEVNQVKQELAIRIFDPVVRCRIKIIADYIVLATGVVAHDNHYLAELFKFSVNSDGFFNGAHPKLKPVDLSVAGLFLAGICNYPKPVDESIEQARAAAFRVSSLLLKKEIKSEAIKAFVTDNCDGCALCVDVCPFHAISLKDQSSGDDRSWIAVDSALCQGCGICSATCPSAGIMVHGFTIDQLSAQVRAAVNGTAAEHEQ